MKSPFLVDEHGRPLEYEPSPPNQIVKQELHEVHTSLGLYHLHVQETAGPEFHITLTKQPPQESFTPMWVTKEMINKWSNQEVPDKIYGPSEWGHAHHPIDIFGPDPWGLKS